MLDAFEFVEAVEGGDFVAFGEGGVVEDGVDEVFDGAFEGHDGLAYVDEFGGVGADGVDTEEGVGVLVDEEFEHADFVVEELAAGDFFVLGDA